MRGERIYRRRGKRCMKSTDSKPLDREVVYAKLMLLSSVASLMDARPQDFTDESAFALSVFLREIAREIRPERRNGSFAASPAAH